MSLFLVRHGAPSIDRTVPARAWTLDPASYDAVWALRDRMPDRAAWFSSPEPKALATAQLLTDTEIGVVDDLREHQRETAAWIDDFPTTVRSAFDAPEVGAHPGWEPLRDCRRRIVAAAQPLLAAHPSGDVVLAGHGTAWTLLVSELTGEAPDLERWAALAMPDLIVLEQDVERPGRWRVRG